MERTLVCCGGNTFNIVKGGTMQEANQEPAVTGGRVTKHLKMILLSDTIFGNGMSIPGEEDISVLTDEQGFPYYKGSTFKGIFREEMERYLIWTGSADPAGRLAALFGEGKPEADSAEEEAGRLVFSDFVMSPNVRKVIAAEIGDNPAAVLDCLSNMRAFTRISEEGTADKGSLRYARCINQGVSFYSTLSCAAEDEDLIRAVLPFVKWIGTLRNRGFGNVRIEIEIPEKGDRTENGGVGT